MTDDYSIESLPDKIRAPALELLICNAGILLDRDLSMKDQYSKDIWAQSFAVNTWGGIFLDPSAFTKTTSGQNPKDRNYFEYDGQPYPRARTHLRLPCIESCGVEHWP